MSQELNKNEITSNEQPTIETDEKVSNQTKETPSEPTPEPTPEPIPEPTPEPTPKPNMAEEILKNINDINTSEKSELVKIKQLLGLFELKDEPEIKLSETEKQNITDTLKTSMQKLLTPSLHQMSAELYNSIKENDTSNNFSVLKSCHSLTKFATSNLNVETNKEQIDEITKRITEYSKKSLSLIGKEIDGVAEKTKDEPVFKTLESYIQYLSILSDLKNSLPIQVDNELKNLEDKTRNNINKTLPNLQKDFENHYNSKPDLFEKLSILSEFSSIINSLNEIEKTPSTEIKQITDKLPLLATSISAEIDKKIDTVIASKQTEPRQKTFEELLTCYAAVRFINENFKNINYDTKALATKTSNSINEIKNQALIDLEKFAKNFESENFIKQFCDNLEKGETLDKIIPEPFIIKSYAPELISEDEDKKIQEYLKKIQDLYVKYMEKHNKDKTEDKDEEQNTKDPNVLVIDDDSENKDKNVTVIDPENPTPDYDSDSDSYEEEKRRKRANKPIDFSKTDPTYAQTKGPKLEEECLSVLTNTAELSYTLFNGNKATKTGTIPVAPPHTELQKGDIVLKGVAGKEYKRLLLEGKSSKEALKLLATNPKLVPDVFLVKDPKNNLLSDFLAIAEKDKIKNLVTEKIKYEEAKLSQLSDSEGDKAILEYKKQKIQNFKDFEKALDKTTNYIGLKKLSNTYIESRKLLRTKTFIDWQKSDISNTDSIKGKSELWLKETREFKKLLPPPESEPKKDLTK